MTSFPNVLLGVAVQADQLAVGRLGPGALYNESVLYSPAAPLTAHLVARVPGTKVVCFELSSIKQALGAPGEPCTGLCAAAQHSKLVLSGASCRQHRLCRDCEACRWLMARDYTNRIDFLC